MFVPPETLRGQAGAHRVAQIALLDTLAVRAAEIRRRSLQRSCGSKLATRSSLRHSLTHLEVGRACLAFERVGGRSKHGKLVWIVEFTLREVHYDGQSLR